MFFTVALKDYLDHLHELYLLFGQLTAFAIAKSLIGYVFHSFLFVISYLVSFRWLWDFVDLPAIAKHNYMVILDGRNVVDATLQIKCDRTFFPMLENFPLNTKTIATGFLNSLFLVLPFTVPSLISLRALLINGIPAGVASAAGSIAGQVLFFTCVLFGFEVIIQPFLTFEPVTILVGCFILLNVVYNMAHKPDFILVNITQNKRLVSQFRLTFVLAWLENACIYNYFGTMTVSTSPNFLQTADSTQWFLVTTFAYLVGLTIGCIIWTALLGWVVMRLYDAIMDNLIYPKIKMSLMQINRGIHHTCSVIIAVLALTSVPYYGMDYLLAGPIGFLSNDTALEKFATHTHFEVPELGTDKVLNMDMSVDTPAFDEPSLLTTQKYEQTAYNAEQQWQNRLNLRQRMQERDQQQIRIQNAFDAKSLTIPRYATEGLGDYFDPLKKQNDFEEITSQVFRDDVYFHYRDSSNRKYVRAIQTHREFRHRYYSNPIYKFLLGIDTRMFLQGQPKSDKLSIDEEYDLNRRRYILQNYLDAVSDYKTFVTRDKSGFSEKVYNQQFKGSLSVIRQYNAVSLNFPDNEIDDIFNMESRPDIDPTTRVLKYDQPLYKRSPKEQKAFLHEELRMPKGKGKWTKRHRLVLNDTGPFYFGWDGSLRKLLVKGSRLPEPFDFGSEFEQQQQQEDLKQNKLPKKFVFQSWSPAITSQSAKRHLKLPSLVATREEQNNLQLALGLKDEDVPVPTKAGESSNFRNMVRQVSTDYLIQRLPQYDWYWKRIYTFDPTHLPYLELGDTLPPQLDGVAWPGVVDRRIKKSLDPFK